MKSNSKFKHGGDISSFCKKYKIKSKEVLDLSSNINFINPKIKTNLNKLDISHYPKYDNLYKIISKRYSVKADEIELFNGGSSAIFSFFKTYQFNQCNIYSPAYLEYKKAIELFSNNINLINRFKNINSDKIKNNSLVIFVNPSTPDGKYYDLKKLMKLWISKNCTIFIDESFLDFTNKSSAVKYLKKYTKLYILKSMTKIYSSAGIRVGTLISNKQNISYIKNFEPLWKLSKFDCIYLKNAIKDKKLISKTYKSNKTIKAYTKKSLSKLNFIKKVYKSEANFLLVKLKKIDSNKLQKFLLKYKVMIRDCSNFDYLDSSFIRVALKSKKDMKYFIKSLKKIQRELF